MTPKKIWEMSEDGQKNDTQSKTIFNWFFKRHGIMLKTITALLLWAVDYLSNKSRYSRKQLRFPKLLRISPNLGTAKIYEVCAFMILPCWALWKTRGRALARLCHSTPLFWEFKSWSGEWQRLGATEVAMTLLKPLSISDKIPEEYYVFDCSLNYVIIQYSSINFLFCLS